MANRKATTIRREPSLYETRRAFQRTALCPKPKAPVTYDHYLGRDAALGRRLTRREQHLIETVVATADVIDTRKTAMGDRDVPWPTAFLLIALPVHMLDDLAAFQASLAEMEVDDDAEADHDREGNATELDHVRWSFGSSDPDSDNDQVDAEVHNWAEPTVQGPQFLVVPARALDNDCEADAVEPMNQTQRCRGDHTSESDAEHDGREPDDQDEEHDGREMITVDDGVLGPMLPHPVVDVPVIIHDMREWTRLPPPPVRP